MYLRGTLRNFGLKVGIVGKLKFEARIKELVESHPDLAVLVEPLLVVRRVLREQIVDIDQVAPKAMTTVRIMAGNQRIITDIVGEVTYIVYPGQSASR